MKEYDNVDYNDEEKDLKTELELDEHVFEPLDEEEGINNDLFDNFEPKDELENENAQIKVNFIPNDESSITPFSKKGPDSITKLDNEDHTTKYKFKVYSEKDVRYWIRHYKHYKNFKKVQNHLRDEGKKVPGISTIQNRIKQLIGQEKYKELTKKYTFNDANKIVKQVGINKTGVPRKILSNPEEFKGVKSKL